MKYNFINAVDRAGSSAIKCDPKVIADNFGLNYYEDTISMWVADMDFACAPEIVEALHERAGKAIFGYERLSDRYFESLSAWYLKRAGMQINRSEVLFSNGTVPAIRDVVRAFTAEGQGVIIQPPVYFPFSAVTRECGRCVVENNLTVGENNVYSIDFEDFELKCQDPNNKLFIFCNPHNPVGQIWSADDTAHLLDICRRNDVIFFSDEVHSDLIRLDAKFTSTLNLDSKKGVIVATAANKTFNLAGLHITNLVIPDSDLRERLSSHRGEVPVSPFSEVASIAAYSQCDEWVDELRAVLDENIRYMDDFIKCHLPKVRFNPPQGTYLAWLDFRDYGVEERELLCMISDKAHVIFEAGSMFSVNSAGFMRVNIACPKAVLVEVMDRLKRLFDEL